MSFHHRGRLDGRTVAKVTRAQRGRRPSSTSVPWIGSDRTRRRVTERRLDVETTFQKSASTCFLFSRIHDTAASIGSHSCSKCIDSRSRRKLLGKRRRRPSEKRGNISPRGVTLRKYAVAAAATGGPRPAPADGHPKSQSEKDETVRVAPTQTGGQQMET